MRKKRIPIVIMIFLLAVIASSLQGCYSEEMPEWAEGFAYDSTEIYPIYVREDGSAFIAATFGGEPVALMFDTSQSNGLSMTDNLVAQMGLQLMEQGSDDEADMGVLYRIPSFTAFGRQWKDQVVQPASEQIYNGSIGPEFINGSRFTLDYDKQLLAVSGSPLPEDLMDENVVPMEIGEHSMLPVVHGWINEEQVLIELDTGSRQTVIDMFLARQLGLDPDEDMYIPEVTIGSYTFEVKSAAGGLLPVSDDLRRIRLGSDVLSHMILTVDYMSESVAIKPIVSPVSNTD